MKIHIDMDPVPKGRPRMTRSGHTYTPQRTRDAEAHIREMATFAMNGKPPMQGPLKMKAVFTIKQPKSNKTKEHTGRVDVDNLFKLLADSLNGVMFEDDGQIIHIEASKKWGDVGGIDVEVTCC